MGRQASIHRVAHQYLLKKARGQRLEPRVKNTLNRGLIRAGLDGNTYFRKPEDGYRQALNVLAKGGLELGEVVSSHLFQGEDGRLTIDLAFTNQADPFSPVDVSNSMLYLTFHRMGSGSFEVIAYLT